MKRIRAWGLSLILLSCFTLGCVTAPDPAPQAAPLGAYLQDLEKQKFVKDTNGNVAVNVTLAGFGLSAAGGYLQDLEKQKFVRDTNGNVAVRVALDMNPASGWATFPAVTNIIPNASNVYSLGSAAFPFKDLFLNTNSLHWNNGSTLGFSSEGELALITESDETNILANVDQAQDAATLTNQLPHDVFATNNGTAGQVLTTSDGTNQAWADVVMAGDVLKVTNNLSDLGDASVARTNLGVVAADTIVSNGVSVAFASADTVVSNDVTSAFLVNDTLVSNDVTSAFGSADIVVSNGVTVAFNDADSVVSNGLDVTITAVSSRVDVVEVRTNLTEYNNDAGFLIDTNNLSDVGDAAIARTNLGVAVGIDVQAASTNLDALAGNDGGNLTNITAAVTNNVYFSLVFTNNVWDVSGNLAVTHASGVKDVIAQVYKDDAFIFPPISLVDDNNLTVHLAAFTNGWGGSTGVVIVVTDGGIASTNNLLKSNNLSDLGDVATARTNLGVVAADTIVSNGVTTAFGSADTVVSNGVTTAFGTADIVVSNGVTVAFGSADTVVSNGLDVTITAVSSRVDVVEARTNLTDYNNDVPFLTVIPSAIFAQLSSSSNQIPADTNATVIEFDTQDDIQGLTHSTTTNAGEITIDTSATYHIVPQPQVAKVSGGTALMFDVFLQEDTGSGFTNIPNSNVKLTVKDADITMVTVIAFTIKLNAGDKLRVMQRVSSTTGALGLYATPADAIVPLTPSIIFTMNSVGPQ